MEFDRKSTAENALPNSARPPAFNRFMLNARWLLQLRWVAVVGQLTTIVAVVEWLGVTLALTPILAIVGFTAASNLAFAVWLRLHQRRAVPRPPVDWDHLVVAGILATDLLLLTGLLYFSGGPENPFAVFYFVNLSLAAVLLPVRWSAGLTFLAAVEVVVLLNNHIPLPALNMTLADDSLFPGRTYQQIGFSVALVACASVVTYFITRVTRELRLTEEELREAEKRRARSERLEALATLAAGAGHELASPLSTIAVIAKDLTKHLEGTNAPESVLEDVALIRSELDQCRRVLDGMASSAGQATGERMQPIRVAELMEEVVSIIRRKDNLRVEIDGKTGSRRIFVPRTATAQAMRGVIRNALDASSFGEPVKIVAHSSPRYVTFIIRDRGAGMSQEVLARVGEPFYTTKEPGKGMGLGLFLARNVIERIGGEMRIESTPGTGTTVTIQIPFGEG